ncbi:hypothetical protein L207DRAFT_573689 [Hyaloscypha variabilis F]|uniref:Uncharacterized protein n=1 Tax=Hyaloscypha variabilis (strain UAMH 11265 / GT02V1 / F) TaxID=1149755 RepID=A0A2J6QVE9_HYAVF|nr:hypothetical protein L207DRAFT_573689 [Hyaloscypha variabilis F]
MDPISIAGLVCAIVSAYTGAASLFQARKARKKERVEKARKAAALQKSLAIAPPQVQTEYDHDFNRIGQQFATGDDIGRNQLATILIDLQSKMIGTLQALLNGGSGSYSSLLDTSDQSRLSTISALGSQYQRLAQAAPIQRSIPATTTTTQSYAQLDHTDQGVSTAQPITQSCALWDGTDQGVLTTTVEAVGPRNGEHRFLYGQTLCRVLPDDEYHDSHPACAYVIYYNTYSGWGYETYRVPRQALSPVYPANPAYRPYDGMAPPYEYDSQSLIHNEQLEALPILYNWSHSILSCQCPKDIQEEAA